MTNRLPAMPPMPSPEDLRQILISSEIELRDAWGRRREDDDVIFLVDARIEEHQPHLIQHWGGEVIRKALLAAEKFGGLPLFTFVEPRMCISPMMRSGDQEKERVAYEFRTIPAGPDANGRVVVPVLVNLMGGLTVTSWTPPTPGVTFSPWSDPMAG